MGDFYNRGGGALTTTIVTTDDLEVDGGTLSVDADNNRVGIGTRAPGTTPLISRFKTLPLRTPLVVVSRRLSLRTMATTPLARSK